MSIDEFLYDRTNTWMVQVSHTMESAGVRLPIM